MIVAAGEIAFETTTLTLNSSLRSTASFAAPQDVFKFLAKKGVGKTTSLFWIAWAYVCEKTNDFKTGDKIFKKATEVGAQPKKMLEQRYSQFKRRMAREFLRIAEEGGEGEEEQVRHKRSEDTR